MVDIIAFKRLANEGMCNVVSNIGSNHLLDDLLHWIVFSASSISSTRLGAIWDLSSIADRVIKMLPDEAGNELLSRVHKTRYGNFKLYYIPEKVFSININSSEMNLYDLGQYYPGESSPVTIEETQLKADQLSSTLLGLGVSRPISLASPMAAFRGEKHVQELMSGAIPTIFDASVPLEVFELALQCTPREWVSNYQIGKFDLFSADLSSAYPNQAAQLLHLDDLTFTESNVLDLSAYYGFLVGDFTVYPNHPLAFCSPFITDQGDGTPINFVGTHRNYPCLLDEVRTLYRYNMGKFKIKYGWFGHPKKGIHPRQPLKGTMEYFYSLRGNGTSPLSVLKSYLLKRVMNGLIGKLLEIRKDDKGNIIEYGDMYNPIFHSIITTRTRLQVFDFLAQNEITKAELVFIGVDGVKTTRNIPLPKVSQMGRWRSSGSEPTIVLSPGAVLSPNRNFKSTGYSEMLSQCQERPTASKFGVNKDIDLRNLWLNQNRSFPKSPRTGGELLGNRFGSEPINI